MRSQYTVVKATGSYKTAHEQLMESTTGANMERICPSIHQLWCWGWKVTIVRGKSYFPLLPSPPCLLSFPCLTNKTTKFTHVFLQSNSLILHTSIIRTGPYCCITNMWKALISNKEVFKHTDYVCYGGGCHYSLAIHSTYRSSNPLRPIIIKALCSVECLSLGCLIYCTESV